MDKSKLWDTQRGKVWKVPLHLQCITAFGGQWICCSIHVHQQNYNHRDKNDLSLDVSSIYISVSKNCCMYYTM